MRSPWTQLYLHLVWTTWKRAPLLVDPIRSEVYDLIQAECTRLRADVLAIGGMEDHVCISSSACRRASHPRRW